MSDGKHLTRVLFTYSDGTSQEIAGPLADEWYQRLKSDGVFLSVHGQEWPEHLVRAWSPVPAPERDEALARAERAEARMKPVVEDEP